MPHGLQGFPSHAVAMEAAAQDAAPVTIGFHVRRQDQTQWCWAAVAQAVEAFYGQNPGRTQCEIANDALGLANCCPPGANPAANVVFSLEDVLTDIGHLIDAGYEGIVGFEDIRDEIQAGNPVCLRVEWLDGGGGHYVGVRGVDPASRELLISDPKSGPQHVAWDAIVAGAYPGSAIYTNTFRTRR